MRKLQQALRREQRLKLLASLGLLLSGAALSLLFFHRSVIVGIAGLILLVLGIKFVFQFAARQGVTDTRLMKLLNDHPREIVWVYSVVTERLPFGFEFSKSGILYFKLADGDEVSVSLSADDLKLVSRFLNRVLPHATFGYTEDREQWYMANPRMLLRPDDEDS